MSVFTPEQEQRLREIMRQELHRALSPSARRAKGVFVTLGEKGPEITFTPLSSRGKPKVKRVAARFDDELVAKTLKKVSADGVFVRGERPQALGAEDA